MAERPWRETRTNTDRVLFEQASPNLTCLGFTVKGSRGAEAC